MGNARIVLLILLLITSQAYCQDIPKSPSEVPISSYLEILDAQWSSKSIDEVVKANDWILAYNIIGKRKMVFQGNWYRLHIDDWLPEGD